jgi:hypothetical protein
MWTFNPKGRSSYLSNVLTFPWKEDIRLCAWRFPYSCVLLRWGEVQEHSLGWPSLPRTHTRTHKSPLPTFREPTLIHEPLPLTTFNRDKKPNYLKLTITEIDSPPASQPAGQKRPGCDHPPKCTERMNDYYRWKFGDNMICLLYYIPLLPVWFFLFFSFGDHFCGFLDHKYIRNFFFIYNFL